MKRFIIIAVTLSLLITTFSIAYYLVVYIPSTKQIPTSTNTVNQKTWNFSNKQYEFNINNIKYIQDYGITHPVYKIIADITLKNISITPYIINGEINRCVVLENDKPTKYYTVAYLPIKKGVLPSETFSTSIEIEFMGEDYDISGNKLYPSGDSKVKSCELILNTNNSTISHKDGRTRDPTDADIEPITIIFP